MCGRKTVFVLTVSIAVVIMAVLLSPIDESQPLAEIWQYKSATETSGITAWNGTIIFVCEPHSDCRMASFDEGRDYVGGGPFPRRTLWVSHSILFIYNLIYYNDPMRMFNEREMCMYGGCYGVQRHTSACPPETRMTWKMFKGCRTPAEHKTDDVLLNKLFDKIDDDSDDE